MDPKVCCFKSDKQFTRFPRKRKYSIGSWNMANILRRQRCGWYYLPDTPREVILGASPTLFLNDGKSRIKQDDEQTSPTDQEISETKCDN